MKERENERESEQENERAIRDSSEGVSSHERKWTLILIFFLHLGT